MAFAGHIIQINLNHSARAQDLLLQTMAEYEIGLAVVAEPYRIPQDYGVGDTTDTAAIVRAEAIGSPTINIIKRDRGFVAATWGRVVVVPERPYFILSGATGQSPQQYITVDDAGCPDNRRLQCEVHPVGVPADGPQGGSSGRMVSRIRSEAAQRRDQKHLRPLAG